MDHDEALVHFAFFLSATLFSVLIILFTLRDRLIKCS